MAEKRRKSKESRGASSRTASSSAAVVAQRSKGKARAQDQSLDTTAAVAVIEAQIDEASTGQFRSRSQLASSASAPAAELDAGDDASKASRIASSWPSDPSKSVKRGAPNVKRQEQQGQNPRRAASVYDAVAGRLTRNGFRPLMRDMASGRHSTTRSSNLPISTPFDFITTQSRGLPQYAHHERRPDESEEAVRQRQSRFKEEQRQFYDSWVRGLPVHEQMHIHRKLVNDADASTGASLVTERQVMPPPLELPAGELLEAIHAYVADFYTGQPGAMPLMQQNMDGTALFALGVLLEEVAREQLGADGDLSLLEDESQDRGLGRRWFNGVREVTFVTEEEIEANKNRKPEYEVADGSLLKELLS